MEGAELDIEQTLKDFGLTWDEKYKQSERLETYKKYADELLAKDLAYFEEGEKGKAIRFRMPKTGITEFEDLVHGKLSFKNELIKDPIILKSDGYPVYNFANVIDDHEMQISDTIRGEEFISSTPLHIQIYHALNWEPPQFAHLPLILDKDRKKLSKRTGDVTVKEYRDKGYLKEALLNFIALLGWNPKSTREIFSLDELISEFDIKKVNRAGAIFDIEKLDFINREWKKKLNLPPEKDPMMRSSIMTLKNQTSNNIGEQAIGDTLIKIWPQVTERIPGPDKVDAMISEFKFYFEDPEYDTGLLTWKETERAKIKSNLESLIKFIESEKSLANLEPKIINHLEEQGIGKGEALWPLRVALTGLKNSPGPFEIMSAFDQIPNGRETVLRRIKNAIEKL